MEIFKSLLFYYIIFSFSFQISFTEDDAIISLGQPFTKNYTDINSDIHITLTINQSDYSDRYYLQFLTSPIEKDKPAQDRQQIIFSSNISEPNTKDTEIYSYKYSKYANLITTVPDNTNISYITIKCFEYSCNFNFEARIEVSGSISLDEERNYYIFSSNSLQGIDKFREIDISFPAIPDNSNCNRASVAVISPDDIYGDYNTLRIENGKEITNKERINSGVIYDFDFDKTTQNKLLLHIESSENQFIMVSTRASNVQGNYIQSEITPNSIAKYSNFRWAQNEDINECFKIDDDYINNYLNDEKSHLLYASINFYSLPISVYLNYSGTTEDIQNNEKKHTLNVILKKKSNEYPQICFKRNGTNLSPNTFMLEIYHIQPDMKYIDIYSPLLSGFVNTRTLLPNTLGVFSHYSNVHYIEKISFYLKPIKGNPKMYIVECNDYPNCYNKYEELKEDKPNVNEADDFGVYQYFAKKYETLTKDESPTGTNQNLVYVYCPSDTNEYCQFDILTYSDLDEIVIHPNENFDAISDKDETLLFKIAFNKGYKKVEKVRICLNASKDDIIFSDMANENKAIVEEKVIKNQLCYNYEIDSTIYDTQKINFGIIFNIKANKSIQYTIINSNNGIKNKKYGEIMIMKDFSFPYSLNYKIDKNLELLFNFYLNCKEETDLNLLDVEIGAIILNEENLERIEEDQTIKILENSLIRKLDLATRSIILNLDQDFINKFIVDTDIIYYLHLVIINKKQNINQEIKVNANMFLYELRENLIEKNLYINDELTIESKNISKLYHLNLETNNKLIMKFSSNYPLDDYFSIYFIESIKDNMDIKYLEDNEKPYNKTQIGQMYTLTYENKNTLNVYMAVALKYNKDLSNLNKINYIFKYNTYKPNENPKTYNFSQNYTLTEEQGSHIFKFNVVKSIEESKYYYGEIYIRKIDGYNRLANESLDTYGKIESNYEIVNGKKISEDDGTYTINVSSKIEENNSYYSIILDIYDLNEKFVIFNRISSLDPTPSPSDTPTDTKTDPKEDGDNSLVLKIVIPIAIVVGLLIIILIIIIIRKKKGGELKDNIMKTSFQETEGYGEGGNLLQDKYINDEGY